MVDQRRNLQGVSHPPGVDRVARSLTDAGLPAPLRVEAARRAVATARETGGDAFALAETEATRLRRTLLTPVINATGVLLHTNLGRAPLALEVAPTATNLELDLETGRRGSRQAGLSRLVQATTGAEDAIVVNNCAGAVLLVLAALATDRGVAVSRGELVEIGGGFRIPDVMVQSGARLVEVGTTNRTRRSDFERVADQVALVMKIHQSNYRIEGFTEAVDVPDLTGLGVPVVADIGSGLLDERCPWLDGPPPTWLADEPGARQTLDRGADLVIFSGDKLLGGPQAGIIAGRADLVAACARHPLARALRPGTHVITALTETLLTVLEGRGTDLPFWRMATLDEAGLRARAEAIVAGLPDGVATIVEVGSTPGGGTLPHIEIPSVGLHLRGDRRDALRWADRPIVARSHGDDTVLDLRTIDPVDDAFVTAALGALDDG